MLTFFSRIFNKNYIFCCIFFEYANNLYNLAVFSVIPFYSAKNFSNPVSSVGTHTV